ncbi:zinc metalloendopeptidase [Seminavis robusta]|uniref:Zinc metalloendopeptidase n=1 Tax=Seminavis robusta TaxID=568900 RepID=A0A9N8HGC3_9STRA|nr:zinc metalloendopeptidase [Seminavis robusta]|eukprot:Sro391_g133090.1 zinc metalloendopeptidase (376) ;mRNA; f:34298-35709
MNSSLLALSWLVLTAEWTGAIEGPVTTRRRTQTGLSGARQFVQSLWYTATSLFDCSDDDEVSNFAIALDLLNVPDDTVFRNAVDKWSKVIIGDTTNFTGNLGGSSACGPWPSSIDDIYICGEYKYIDGQSGILGSAGPRHYRPSEGLPLTGTMSFETVDVENTIQDLFGVILHEMAHVLGIGALWTINGLATSNAAPCTYKSDSAASREYQALSGCNTAIPLEQGHSNGGSNCVHWAESCFLNEVMTSVADAELPITRLTIAGLEDMGYTVDYSHAQGFDSSDMDPSCLCNRRDRRNLKGDTVVRKLDGPEHRQLSAEGMAKAMSYGQEIIAQNKEEINLLPETEGAIDLGGQLIYVLYMEDETVYSIQVTANDD